MNDEERIEKLINAAAVVKLAANALEPMGLVTTAVILQDVFEDIMRVAASLQPSLQERQLKAAKQGRRIKAENGPKTTMVSVLKLPHKNPDHPGGITARTVLDHQTLPQTQSPE